ncbi:MAG: selenium cofactor biosynthesis protein YqeC [Sphaerochaetaceae bacterium]|jgi:probable selenium-dependent hydroxylase accessory protein YqeC|nr:selenium cofactor biosynthesis protein YqeC [Sphaerochaetaceae bacterium]NLO61189.1 putative selenium-dependent hydroxylase accessory protein YqeC [Spirochaetales bacterium]MDD2406473.1 selenium cofactor biosynthesis protein YqeC [Sphaerochaetaceae bacterium]MDD4259448.1 selenium cofactor biosynthesis protein YqeC [Sphaerochaetaceae bacterium]MDD4762452.1 selenium cofactor biosynthesis protein YqeC [Sphaerochaetaceae bacterium]
MGAYPERTGTSLTAEVDASIRKCSDAERLWITVTGSGGKTTTIERMAQYWARQHLSVLVSTTTKMASISVHHYPFDILCINDMDTTIIPMAVQGKVVLWGQTLYDTNKFGPVPERSLKEIIGRFDRVIIEGDGAKGTPLKFHSTTDPVIPSWTDVVIGVIGLGSYGEPLNGHTMHNADVFRKVTQFTNDTISLDVFQSLLEHEDGVFKGTQCIPTMLLCNQTDMVQDGIVHAMREIVKENHPGNNLCSIAGSWKLDRLDWVDW